MILACFIFGFVVHICRFAAFFYITRDRRTALWLYKTGLFFSKSYDSISEEPKQEKTPLHIAAVGWTIGEEGFLLFRELGGGVFFLNLYSNQEILVLFYEAVVLFHFSFHFQPQISVNHCFRNPPPGCKVSAPNAKVNGLSEGLF